MSSIISITLFLLAMMITSCSYGQQASGSASYHQIIKLEWLSNNRLLVIDQALKNSTNSIHIVTLDNNKNEPDKDIELSNNIEWVYGIDHSGKYLLCQSNRDDNSEKSDLAIYDLHDHSLKTILKGAALTQACWKNGQEIACLAADFGSNYQAHFSLDIMTIEGKRTKVFALPGNTYFHNLNYDHHSDSFIGSGVTIYHPGKLFHSFYVCRQGKTSSIKWNKPFSDIVAYDSSIGQITNVVDNNNGEPEIIRFGLDKASSTPTILMSTDQVGHDCLIESLSVSSKMNLIALGRITHGTKKEIMIYDLNSHTYSYIQDSLKPAFSPDGKSLAYAYAGAGDKIYADKVYVKKLDEEQSNEVYNSSSQGLSFSLQGMLGGFIIFFVILASIYSFRMRTKMRILV